MKIKKNLNIINFKKHLSLKGLKILCWKRWWKPMKPSVLMIEVTNKTLRVVFKQKKLYKCIKNYNILLTVTTREDFKWVIDNFGAGKYRSQILGYSLDNVLFHKQDWLSIITDYKLMNNDYVVENIFKCKARFRYYIKLIIIILRNSRKI